MIPYFFYLVIQSVSEALLVLGGLSESPIVDVHTATHVGHCTACCLV